MRRSSWIVAVGLGAAVAAGALRSVLAGDDEEGAFDSEPVRELAAKADALSVDDEMALMRRLRRSMDRRLLTPSAESWKGFEGLRERTDAGLARILERGLYEGFVSPRCGGAYWSFTKRSNDYDHEPQLELQKGSFGSGFYGGTAGIVRRMERGDILSIEKTSVPEDMRAAAAEVKTAARAQRKDRPKAEAGGLYAVRAVMPGECDVLAAFQVIAVDAKGATIAWRLLERYETPPR